MLLLQIALPTLLFSPSFSSSADLTERSLLALLMGTNAELWTCTSINYTHVFLPFLDLASYYLHAFIMGLNRLDDDQAWKKNFERLKTADVVRDFCALDPSSNMADGGDLAIPSEMMKFICS